VPAAARAYRSKPEVAAALVEHVLGQRLVRADWVGGDAAYGNSPALRQAVLLPVWRWETDNERGAAAQALHLLISREPDTTPVHYSRCYCPPRPPALSLEQALYRQRQRYWMERVFQEAKQPLGLPQNQTRSWPAWQHHVARTMMALPLLLDTQLPERETIPNRCFASLKLVLAQKLQKLLQQDDALLAAIQQRAQANAPKRPRTHSP